jgi:hypothetical protein
MLSLSDVHIVHEKVINELVTVASGYQCLSDIAQPPGFPQIVHLFNFR